MVTSELKEKIKQALFIDKVGILSEVSLTYEGKPYSISNISKQDIKVAVNSINNDNMILGIKDKGFKLISFYTNGYGVLILKV